MMAGKKEKYLFVCYANENRSPTAAEVCRRIARASGLEIEAKSAGISRAANKPLTREMADEADKIFVMEEYMKMALIQEYGQNPGKIICLDIPDVYNRADPWLVNIIEDRLYEFLAEEDLI
jgi:predicted protein tyrosine phosphatase